MGNALQGKSGNASSSLNVPPTSLFDAIARASKEASKRQGKFQKSVATFDSSDEYDSDSDLDEIDENSKMKGLEKKDKKAMIKKNMEPADPESPWLISTKNELDMELSQLKAVKEKCSSNYPGMLSSYVEKVKWAEANSRSFQAIGNIGNILRDVIYEKGPDDILVQVLIRKRSLSHILTCDEDIAQAFFSLFIATPCYKPDFLLRPNAPISVYDTNLAAKDRMEQYINWIDNEDQSGTVLSPKPLTNAKKPLTNNETKQTEKNPQCKKPVKKNNGRSPLLCFFNIKAKKNTLLSKDIVEAIASITKPKLGCHLINIGPSPLPTHFVNTLLQTEPDTKVGNLPQFPAPDYYHLNSSGKSSSTNEDEAKKNQIICAAVEIMISVPKSDTNMNELKEETSTNPSNHSQKKLLHHYDHLYTKLIQERKQNTNKTFFIVNARVIDLRSNSNSNFLSPSFMYFQKHPFPSDTHFPVIWMSSYFDVCFPRIFLHYNRGRGECNQVKRKILTSTCSSNEKNSEQIKDYYFLKLEFIESNLNVIIENQCKLSLGDQFCCALALTLVIAIDSSEWTSKSLESFGVGDNVSELFEDLSCFWKSLIRKRNEDIGLGLKSSSADNNGCASRKSLLQLLKQLEKVIRGNYGHLLEDKQVLDFGVSDNDGEMYASVACVTHKKRLQSPIAEQTAKKQRKLDDGTPLQQESKKIHS